MPPPQHHRPLRWSSSLANGYKGTPSLMTTNALLSLLLMMILTLHVTHVDARTCDRVQKTLTSQCNSLCTLYHPCVIIDEALDTDSDCGEPVSGVSFCVVRVVDPCHYECFFPQQKPNDQNYTTFSFFVPFGAYRSKQDRELSANDPAWVAQVSALTAVKLNDSVAWKDNDKVQKIDYLELPDTCTNVVLVGGTTEQSVKGKVASVEFAANAFSNNTFVTNVKLVNLNLETAAAAKTLAEMLPAAQLTMLTLTNTLISTFPAGLTSLKQLLTLDLDQNYITAVTPDDSLDTLQHLNLQGNNVTSFAAAMPNLQSLNLSSNALTEIPSVVFQMTKLKALSMDGNPLKAPTISATQYSFLQRLTTLTLSVSSDGALPCETSQQKTISGVSICVLDDSEFVKSVTTSAPPASSTDSSTAAASSSSSSSAAMIGGIAGGVVVVAIVGATLWVSSKRRKNLAGGTAVTSKQDPNAYTDERTPTGTANSKKRTELSAGGNNSESSSGSGGNNKTFVSIWNDPDLLSVQLNFDDIQDIKTIGSGAYGVVWLVKYRNSQVLASKRLKPGETDRQRTHDFIDEIKLVAKFDHPHIVQFIGAAWTVESDIQALFDYCENGDLKTYLLDEYTPKHWTQEKLQIAIGIVEALVYVHSFTPPLVHRDLKSRNVLLSEDLEAKLTDFGVSRFRSEDNTMTAGVGTAKWLAPEVISGASDYDQSADIYAFGVVLSEIDTHETPFTDVKGTNGNPLAEIALLQMVAKGNLVPNFSASCPENIRELAMRCLEFKAADRPSAVEIAYVLRTIQKSLYTSL